MTALDHLQAAQEAARVLANGNLIPTAKTAIIHHWAGHVLAYLKGARNGR